MLENLFNLVKENAGAAVINNPAIPNEQNDAVVHEASNSIVDGIKNALANGNVNDVMHMFSGQTDAASTPVAQQIQGGFVQNLMNKFGLDQGQAGNIASSLIPNVLSKFVSQTNDPNNSSFDLQGIMNHLSGGSTSGFDVQGLMNKFKGGLDQNGDGKVDLSDLTSMFKGGGESSGGGIMDTIKGLFK
ncbi:hypothetical protein ACI6Q2_00500 [Chitinophagaceae bacterium LWZ2-11]